MKLFFGLVFILVGVLLLFGFFTANLWANVLDNFIAVWPVIFIFIGLSVMSNIRSLRWLNVVNGILIVLFVLFLFFWRWDIGWMGPLQEYTLPAISLRENEKEVKIIFRAASLDVEFAAQSAEDPLIQGTYFSHAQNLVLKQSENVITIDFPRKHAVTLTKNYKKKIKMVLPRQYSYQIVIESGTARFFSSFEDNPFSRVEINTAIGTIDSRFKRTEFPIAYVIKSAIGNVDITLPKDTPYFTDIRAVFRTIDLQGSQTRKEEETPISIRVESAIVRGKIAVSEGE
ncbi:MAG TPA: hypothetical protein PLO74_08425 [Thermotogota bacterium]|nr:hypothetical protein [Thermotogota bacterium]